MSQELDYYGDLADPFSEFPEQLKALLSLVARGRQSEIGMTLHPFAASLVHPDCVCNLTLLSALPADVKEAVLAAFSYCLAPGLTPDEQGKVVRFLFPA